MIKAPKLGNSFLEGMLFMYCVNAMSMDAIGKTNYGKYVVMFWADTKWWYWPILFAAWMIFARVVDGFLMELEFRRWQADAKFLRAYKQLKGETNG